MNYRESLDFLYGLQRFGIKLGLENIQALLELLGHPEQRFAIVHVAGTNGKGSVCATLAEILNHAGLRTGLYTSPHLHSFTERIRVDGEPISEIQVGALAAELRLLAAHLPATFFEMTTALALEHFRRAGVEAVVLEVGMGGRLDATNAVDPLVSVITPVCLDHAAHLGENLATIAAEKGGIIKPDVPVVIGRQEPQVLEVLLAIARERGAPVLLAGRDFFWEPEPAGTFAYRGEEICLRGLEAGLPGRHQQENLSLSLTAALLLQKRGMAVSEEALRDGVRAVRWPGRLEWWGEEILLDGAHNEGGARVLADYLSERPGTVRWVAGIKGDKRLEDILCPLLPRVGALYATEPPVESAIAAPELACAAREAGVPAQVFADPVAAFQAALADRQPGEIVLVAGSLFLVAAIREHLLAARGKAA